VDEGLTRSTGELRALYRGWVIEVATRILGDSCQGSRRSSVAGVPGSGFESPSEVPSALAAPRSTIRLAHDRRLPKIKITGGIFRAPARKIPPDKLIKRQQCPTCPNIEVLGIYARELAPLVVGGAEVWGGAVPASTRVDKARADP
jgi:hypothetical protein